jgi:hypothetical protein
MKATREQKEEFNKLYMDFDRIHGLRDNYEELENLINKLGSLIKFIEVEE